MKNDLGRILNFFRGNATLIEKLAEDSRQPDSSDSRTAVVVAQGAGFPGQVWRNVDCANELLMPQLNTKDGKLFVDETEVLEGYESFSGWYWFITERDAYGEGIHFAFVQGTHDEWGSVSQQELESLYPKVWKINDIDLPHAGRR